MVQALRLLLTALAVASIVTPALSQIRELKSTRDGEGSLTFGERASNSRVTKVTLWIQERGVVGITLAQGVKDTFEGKWKQVDSRKISFELTKIGRDKATGSGEAELDGRGSFKSLSLSGYTGDIRFDFLFTVNDWGDATDHSDAPLINRTEFGSGKMDWGSNSRNHYVKSVRVRMMPDHRIEVDGNPASNDLIAGKWWRKAGDQIGFDIDRLTGDVASGSGTLTLDGKGSFSRVDLTGRYRGSTFTMSFRVTGAPAGEGDTKLSSSQEREFVGAARDRVRGQFSRSTKFEFWDDSVGGLANGERNVKGYLRARGGNKPGTYRYAAVVSNSNKRVKSVSVTRL